MAKVKTTSGYRFVKELGGAIPRSYPSRGAQMLEERHLLQGRILDYGCGFGFDADHYGWEAYDPYYRCQKPSGSYDTIVCNHVLNMLTRGTRTKVLHDIQQLLSQLGTAYLIVPRNIPSTGKAGLRKRMQNYVVLTLPTLFEGRQLAIYQLQRTSTFEDLTNEFEKRF